MNFYNLILPSDKLGAIIVGQAGPTGPAGKDGETNTFSISFSSTVEDGVSFTRLKDAPEYSFKAKLNAPTAWMQFDPDDAPSGVDSVSQVLQINPNASLERGRYRKDRQYLRANAGGEDPKASTVRLRGVLGVDLGDLTQSSYVCGVVPDTFKPEFDRVFPARIVWGSSELCFVRIDTAGNVSVLRSGSWPTQSVSFNAYVYLDGISFEALDNS